MSHETNNANRDGKYSILSGKVSEFPILHVELHSLSIKFPFDNEIPALQETLHLDIINMI